MSEILENPYVGPRSFKEAEARVFHGREVEAEALLSLVISEPLVLFYAQSGAGKSSLINAKLRPGLQEEDFLVLPNGRVSGALPEGLEAASNIYLYNLLSLLDEGQTAPEELAQMELGAFWRRLRARPGNQDRAMVLIIDQFEEIMTTNRQHWPERADFYRQLGKAIEDDDLLWVVLAMREDFVAGLDPYAGFLPDRLRARFHMQRLGHDAALEAVIQPADSLGVTFPHSVATYLVDRLCETQIPGQSDTYQSEFVEAVQLQVVCQRLWQDTVLTRGARRIERDDIPSGYIDKALIHFYEGVLEEVATEEYPASLLRSWIEDNLITEMETRATIYQGETHTAGLPNTLIAGMIRKYLVKDDIRPGGVMYELAHDRLVEPIVDDKKARLAARQSPLLTAARKWADEARNPRLVLRGVALEQARQQVDRAPESYSGLEREFVVASAELERQRVKIESTQRQIKLEYQKFLSETGWGVIFADNTDPAIHKALKPLLDLRKQEATLKDSSYYKEFFGEELGVQAGESARKFLDRHGVGVGQVDPGTMPYYLLIVGDPLDEPPGIPFEFQYQLAVDFAVGRIAFETVEEYRRYAESVVAAESGDGWRPRRLTIFSPLHRENRPTRMSSELLAQPALEKIMDEKPDWEVIGLIGGPATKENLGRSLGGDETPALLFTLGHGMPFNADSEKQLPGQGAFVCEDWPGPKHWQGPLTEDMYFAAADVGDDADLHGLITFAFNSFAAGTPRLEDFAKGAFRDKRKQIAPHAFVARLPQRLMGHPRQGMLAMIGHVENTYTSSFAWPGVGAKTGVDTFAGILMQLMEGCPVGAAMEPLNRRYAYLAAELALELQEIDFGKEENPYQTSTMWTSTIDARNWIILGDPAVRLMVEYPKPDQEALEIIYRSESLIEKGAELAKQAKFEQAYSIYYRALETNPWLDLDPLTEVNRLSAPRLFGLARRLVDESNIAEATSLLKRAVSFDPDNAARVVEQLLELGRGRTETGDYPGAVALFEAAQSLDPEIKLEPDDQIQKSAAAALVKQARKLAKKGEVLEARAKFEEAQKLDPELDLVIELELKELSVEELLRKALERESAGKRQEAKLYYEAAETTDASLASQINRLRAAFDHIGAGLQLVAAGSIELAARDLDAALALYPNVDMTRNTRAGELGEKVAEGMVSMAKEKAIEGHQKAATALFKRANLYNPRLNLDPEEEVKKATAAG